MKGLKAERLFPRELETGRLLVSSIDGVQILCCGVGMKRANMQEYVR